MRTASHIAATSLSTLSSKVASNATSLSNRSSKSESAVESRAISGMGADRLGERVEQRLDCVALGLERRLVDDQAGADGTYVLDRAQAVGAQGAARRHQVDDRVGQAEQGRELH